jgi:hypothetical protein
LRLSAAAAALLLAAALIYLYLAERGGTANAATQAPRSTESSQARAGREAGSARAAFVPDTEPIPGDTDRTARMISKLAAASLRPFLESVTRIHELRIRGGVLQLRGDTMNDALFRQASGLTRGAVEELTVEPAGPLGRRSFLLRVGMSPQAERPGLPGAAQAAPAERFQRAVGSTARGTLSEGSSVRGTLLDRRVARFVGRSGPERLSYDHASGLVTAGFTRSTEAVADALATLWRTNPHLDSLAIRAGTAYEALGLDLRLAPAPRRPGGDALREEQQAHPVPDSVRLVFAELLERMGGPQRDEGGEGYKGGKTREVAKTSRPSASGPLSAPPGAAASGPKPDRAPRLVGTIRIGDETSRCLRDPETGLVFVQSTTETPE